MAVELVGLSVVWKAAKTAWQLVDTKAAKRAA